MCVIYHRFLNATDKSRRNTFQKPTQGIKSDWIKTMLKLSLCGCLFWWRLNMKEICMHHNLYEKEVLITKITRTKINGKKIPLFFQLWLIVMELIKYDPDPKIKRDPWNFSHSLYPQTIIIWYLIMERGWVEWHCICHHV